MASLKLHKIHRVVSGPMVRSLTFHSLKQIGMIPPTQVIKGSCRCYSDVTDTYSWVEMIWSINGKYDIDSDYDLLTSPLVPNAKPFFAF